MLHGAQLQGVMHSQLGWLHGGGCATQWEAGAAGRLQQQRPSCWVQLHLRW